MAAAQEKGLAALGEELRAIEDADAAAKNFRASKRATMLRRYCWK